MRKDKAFRKMWNGNPKWFRIFFLSLVMFVFGFLAVVGSLFFLVSLENISAMMEAYTPVGLFFFLLASPVSVFLAALSVLMGVYIGHKEL